jgi:hypothetical protein
MVPCVVSFVTHICGCKTGNDPFYENGFDADTLGPSWSPLQRAHLQCGLDC